MRTLHLALLSLGLILMACGDDSAAGASATASETDTETATATESTSSGTATVGGSQTTTMTSTSDSDTETTTVSTSDSTTMTTTDTDSTTNMTDPTGTDDTATMGTMGTADTGDTGTMSGTGDSTGGNMMCFEKTCQGKLYECGDCEDNDIDLEIDLNDIDCWGPCDNNESGWKGNIPGQNAAPCKMDCYWDGDSGSGNDDCHWSHKCDPLEPQLPKCEYNPDANIPGTKMDCDEALNTQSDQCNDVCGPLTPNGCDCFGCCEVTVNNITVTVYVGSEDDKGEGTCNKDNALDPDLCHPCTQVIGCLNPCEEEECELCFGEDELPEECEEPKCDMDVQPCLMDEDCPQDFFCNTGCCQPVPQ